MWKTLKQIVRHGIRSEPAPEVGAAVDAEASRIQREILDILGQALAIREVDAGSCNGCELEINALGNPYYNLEGLGIKFVASPRHADMLLVTGPVSRNMAPALRLTYEATPDPRLVVAIGDCGCDGGIFGENYACCGHVANVIPVDVSVAGCPPEPIEILRGILTAVRYSAGRVSSLPKVV
ncbi:MAG: formate hydrogenlyase [Georgfuchsia sp.]